MALYLNAKRERHSLNSLSVDSLRHCFNLVLIIDNCPKNFFKETTQKKGNSVMEMGGL